MKGSLLMCSLVVAVAAGAAGAEQQRARVAFVGGDRGIYVVNSDGSGLRRLPLPRRAGRPEWSRDGRRMVFEVRGPRSRLYVANGDGTRQRVLFKGVPYSCFETDWHPRGTRIAFLENEDCGGYPNLYVVDADGSRRRRIVRNDGFAPTWSPSGDRILFMNGYLWTVRVDGRGRRRIPRAVTRYPTGYGDKQTVAWSRSGQVLFIGPGGGLAVVGTDGGGLRRLTPDGMLVTSFHLSPDGRALALAASPRGRNSDEDIYLLGSDGTGLRALTDNRIPDQTPRWSPDGRQIAFRGDDGIYVVDAEGGEPRKLATDADATSPRWVLRGD